MATNDEFPTARRASVIFVHNDQLILWGGMSQIILGEGDNRLIIDIDLPNPDTTETALEIFGDHVISTGDCVISMRDHVISTRDRVISTRDHVISTGDHMISTSSSSDPDTTETALEIFDLSAHEWKKQETTGKVPRMGQGSFFAVIRDTLYIYGGVNDENYFEDLYQLDLEMFVWTRLPNTGGPSPKAFGGMVAYDESLIMLGGVGSIILKSCDKGSQYVSDRSFNHEFGSGWNNAMHEYGTITRVWREVDCGGMRPPPCEKLSLNRIDRHRAILFGGKQEKYSAGYKAIFILDLDMLTWNGPYGPTSPNQKWPEPRGLHSCACLVDPNSDIAETEQKIVMFWGEGLEAKILRDIWVLTVSSMTWKELQLDIPLRPRKYHMSCSYYIRERQTDVYVFGGNKQRSSKFDRHVMTGLMVFRFGSVRSLQESCLLFIKTNWALYDKIINTQLPTHFLTKLEKFEQDEVLSTFYPLEKHFC